MTTQTVHGNTQTAQQQGSHHWVMTVELPGHMTYSTYGTWTPPAGATRHDVFMAIKEQISKNNPELASANVMFFALEPNQL
ncbi:hypothetical protein ABZ419_25270 [Streptomyces cinnamoneus]|uniref:hypothetical protein n=1 Tax=Streptomyces cinnamoneus TaxID=53446 RepID=UPI0034000465